MKKILVVEDSRFFSNVIKKWLDGAQLAEAVYAKSFSEAKEVLTKQSDEFYLALLDLNLPDAPDGEVVDLTISLGVPAIVFTATYCEEMRRKLLKEGILDYIVKDSPASLAYLKSLVSRTLSNNNKTALIVSDNAVEGIHLGEQLRLFRLNVIEAKNGNEALEALKLRGDIAVMIVDDRLPDMKSLELIKESRRNKIHDDMVVFALSDGIEHGASAQFLKYGATDFVLKPIRREELYCRLTMALNSQDQVAELRTATLKDPLTQLYNSKFFEEASETLFASAARRQISLTVIDMEVDRLDEILQEYGAVVSNGVIKAVAEILKLNIRSTDIAARISGGAFKLLLVNMEAKSAVSYVQNLQEKMRGIRLGSTNKTWSPTISFGVCERHLNSVEAMLDEAGAMLFEAKRSQAPIARAV